jgi:GNAT superfamily N-acetyltransferase
LTVTVFERAFHIDTMAPPCPFASARLTYRSIRAADSAIFNAITADTIGFINSNTSNIHLPSDTDTTDFMKYCADKCLLGAVVWLSHPDGITKDEIKALKEASEYGEATVEGWGTAIGQLHLTRLAPDAVHHRYTEIAIDILPEFQGKGYGSEAVTWALDYAFRRANLHRVRGLSRCFDEINLLTLIRYAYVHSSTTQGLSVYMRDWVSSMKVEKERHIGMKDGGGTV